MYQGSAVICLKNHFAFPKQHNSYLVLHHFNQFLSRYNTHFDTLVTLCNKASFIEFGKIYCLNLLPNRLTYKNCRKITSYFAFTIFNVSYKFQKCRLQVYMLNIYFMPIVKTIWRERFIKGIKMFPTFAAIFFCNLALIDQIYSQDVDSEETMIVFDVDNNATSPDIISSVVTNEISERQTETVIFSTNQVTEPPFISSIPPSSGKDLKNKHYPKWLVPFVIILFIALLIVLGSAIYLVMNKGKPLKSGRRKVEDADKVPLTASEEDFLEGVQNDNLIAEDGKSDSGRYKLGD